MRSSTLVLTLCAALAAGAALAQDQGGPRGFLTPEQRAMMHDQDHANWQSMTPEQRAQMRDQMRAKWQAMSDSDKQKLKAELQAKWDALSPAQKQAVEQKIAERRAHWQENHGQ